MRNISMFNSSEGVRIKVWPDSYSEKSAALTGGGGGGLVRNVTYDGMWLDNVDYGLTVTQCYGQDNETACFEHPVCWPPKLLSFFAWENDEVLKLIFCSRNSKSKI